MLFIFIPGCQADYIYLPGIGRYFYPLTVLGLQQWFPCPGVANIIVTRLCGLNGEWMEPDYRNCSDAIVEQKFKNVQDLLNKV